MKTYEKALICSLLVLLSGILLNVKIENILKAQAPDKDEKAVTITAERSEEVNRLTESIPLAYAITNNGQKPVYIKVDKSGFLPTNVSIEDANGTRIHPRVLSPPPPPRYFWMKKDGKKVYTFPVLKIEPRQTIYVPFPDALKLYRDQLQEGTYYLKPKDIVVIHEATIIFREDVSHPLWINPRSIQSKSRYKVNMAENRIRLASIRK